MRNAPWNDIHHMLEAMDLFRTRMNSVFSEFDRSYPAGQEWRGIAGGPRTNLRDTGDHLEIIAEVPGVAKEDLRVKIQGNYLEISGTRHTPAPEGYTTHRSERRAGNFSRSFTLPYDVDANKVEAYVKDGLLNVRLPKSENAKARQIDIH